MAGLRPGDSKRKHVREDGISNEELMDVLLGLKQKFENKIEFDKHKNELFDKMHKQLEDYQNDAIGASVMPITMDLIILIDTIKKNQSYICKKCSEKDYKKLYDLYMGVSQDLEAVLLRQDIEPYTEDNDKINIKRQKVNKVVYTSDEDKNNMVKESVAPGYEKFGRIIRPEKVDIYKYKGKSNGK